MLRSEHFSKTVRSWIKLAQTGFNLSGRDKKKEEGKRKEGKVEATGGSAHIYC